MSLKDETLRYLGYKGQKLDSAAEDALDRAIAESSRIARPVWTWREFELISTPDGLFAGGTVLAFPGNDIAGLLCGCERVILSAVTLGLNPDREIALQFKRDMAYALFLDAAASALAEDACDSLESELSENAAARGLFLTRRFSPGYGDLPLSLQPLLLDILDAGRRIGVTCGPSYIMTPRKSVTAVTGLKRESPEESPHSCEYCDKRDSCPYRRTI